MKSFKIGDLNIKLPIIQGGMGVCVSLSGLASAVANEGGVGVISAAGLGIKYRKFSKDYLKANTEGLRQEISKARAKSNGIIGVNIMVALSNFTDLVKVSVAEKIDIIFAGAGLPLDLPSFLDKMSHTKLVPIVSSSRAFKLLCNKWMSNYNYLPDAVVIEGPKAGGHLGYKKTQLDEQAFSLEALVPQIVETAKEMELLYGKKIPVIAAGGIHSGEDVGRILALGADAVQIGSRFVTTDECDADIKFKNVYLEATKDSIEVIASPVGMPGRVISGEFTKEVEAGHTKPKACPYKCIKTCNYETSPYCIVVALYNAAMGNLKKGFVFAGSNAYLSNKITSVKETMSSIVSEYEDYKKKLLKS